MPSDMAQSLQYTLSHWPNSGPFPLVLEEKEKPHFWTCTNNPTICYLQNLYIEARDYLLYLIIISYTVCFPFQNKEVATMENTPTAPPKQ